MQCRVLGSSMRFCNPVQIHKKCFLWGGGTFPMEKGNQCPLIWILPAPAQEEWKWLSFHGYGETLPLGTELQKVGILVSRIPDISGRKSGHFQIVAANLRIFGIKGYNTVDLWYSSSPNEDNWEENKQFFTFMRHIMAKHSKCMFRTIFCWKSGYWTKKVSDTGGTQRQMVVGDAARRKKIEGEGFFIFRGKKTFIS